MVDTKQARRRASSVALRGPESAGAAEAGVQSTLGNSVALRALAGDALGGIGGVVRSAMRRPGNAAMARAIDRGPDPDALAGVGSGGGTPLPDAMRARFEAAMGHDFGHVRVHADARSQDAAAGLSAEAFALGSHLYFGAGGWSPGSAATDRLLAHELTHVVQADEGRLPGGGGVSSPTDPAEREAYGQEQRVVSRLRSPDAGAASDVAPARAATGPAHPKLTFPRAKRLKKLELVGDGTHAKPGIPFGELQGYVAGQADWFTEPTLTEPDRDFVWRTLLLLERRPDMATSLQSCGIGEVHALSADDKAAIGMYAAGFHPTAESVRISTPAADLARVLELGRALVVLKTFVPPPVMRIVIPESGLYYLVDKGKLATLQAYYMLFQPTLENPAEWEHVEKLLDEGLAPNAPLLGWIHDLHAFTPAARKRLAENVGKTDRSKPLMLILYSQSDWNTAFLQNNELEGVVTSDKNLALVVQAPGSIAAAAARVDAIADTYGQTRVSFDWSTWEWSERGEIAQIIIAGHGSALTVEMAGTGANPVGNNDQYVTYDNEEVDGGKGAGSDTEKLLDKLIERSPPTGVHIVFAGCLVGSHATDPNLNLGGANPRDALRADLDANPNLADYARQRLAASGKSGDVVAANASTPFGALGLDKGGRAELYLDWDPAISGPKVDYLKTGVEPEGALRAVMECYADPAIGPAKTTDLVRARAKGLEKSTDFWESLVYVAFDLSLPAAPALVNIGKVNDLSHRVSAWLLSNNADEMDVGWLAGSVKAGEHGKLFPKMLAANTDDHLQVGVREIWMTIDAAQEAPFLAALDASAFDRAAFGKYLVRKLVDPHLVALLPAVAAPSRGQMLLALTIAVQDGDAMPVAVRDLLRAAAGGKATRAFPADRHADDLLGGYGQSGVLADIGLAPGSGGGGGDTPANVDVNRNGRNDRFVAIGVRETTVKIDSPVIAAPSPGTRRLGAVKSGDPVRAMGTSGPFTLIDFHGRMGYVATASLA